MRTIMFQKAAMGRFAARLMACTACALLAAPASLAVPATASSAEPYPQMAPINAYLMDRTQEITLAKTAAPSSISKDATVLVLTRTGYETAVTGTNGFVCWVGRSFSAASDAPERWNPKIRAAECLNPPAARSVAPIVKLRTNMILAGRSDAETITRIKAALRTGEIPALEAGAMSYMMSRTAYLTDEGDHAMPHVMFFVALRDGTDWGANVPDSPIIGGNYWFFTPAHKAEAASLPPMSVLISPVCNWSDGTPAGAHNM